MLLILGASRSYSQLRFGEVLRSRANFFILRFQFDRSLKSVAILKHNTSSTLLQSQLLHKRVNRTLKRIKEALRRRMHST